MHVIFLFGFMLPVAAIQVWKTLHGVDWKTAFQTCSANESRLPRVRVNNNVLELEDPIPLNISSIFWLGAVYEPLQINALTDDDLGFPRVCCGVFPALSDMCIDNCIPCQEFHAYKCMIGERSDFEGVGPWIRLTKFCLPTTMSKGDKDDRYWTYDIRVLNPDPTTSGQKNATCIYYCAGSVLRGDCSTSSGIDAICVTDNVVTSYSSSTSTVSTKVTTDAGNSSLENTDGTSSTHSITNTERPTDASTKIHTRMTEGSDDQRSTMQLTLTSFAFTNLRTKSNKDTYSTSSTMSEATLNPYVTSMSTQVTTSVISTSNTGNALNITKDSPYVFITLIAVMATVLIAFCVVLFMYCRLRRTRLKSHKSETNMTDNLLFPDSNRLNPIYGTDYDFVENGDPHRHVGYLDQNYYTASDVSAFPTGVSNREIRLPHGSEQWLKVRGSMNTDTYARPMKLPRARPPSSEDKEEKRKNKNAGGDLAIYAFPMKNGKFRKYSNDAEGTLDTIDHRSMDNVNGNVSKSRLSEQIHETSEGDYDITDFSGRTLENETSQNIYGATNFPLSRPSALINTYL